MEDFISVSEIEMMRVKGGLTDDKSMYQTLVPYGVVKPPYGVDLPYIYQPQPPYGVEPPY